MQTLSIWISNAGQHFWASRTAYPELFAVVGGSVPDLRGLFLRGVGGNSAALGQAQGDAIRNITGSIEGEAAVSPSGVFRADPWGDGGFAGAGIGVTNFTFDASRVVPTAEENRPVNKAVRYLIRAKP